MDLISELRARNAVTKEWFKSNKFTMSKYISFLRAYSVEVQSFLRIVVEKVNGIHYGSILGIDHGYDQIFHNFMKKYNLGPLDIVVGTNLMLVSDRVAKVTLLSTMATNIEHTMFIQTFSEIPAERITPVHSA